MIKIFVIGTGNLGGHLCRRFEAGGDLAFAKAGNQKTPVEIQLTGYYNKSGASVPGVSAPRAETLEELPPTDLILIAVPDDKIRDLSEQIPMTDAVVAHTSGNTSLDALSKHKNRGVFYLPQSFSKSRVPDFSKIPICLEWNTATTGDILESLASTMGSQIHHLPSEKRQHLHLAAVFMNNFVNHCYHKSQQILENGAIDPAILDALMEETFAKARSLSPATSQTGPALRNDIKTMNSHLELLPATDRELYRVLSNSIQNEFKK
ncbi:hypothetical protein BST97_01465 [Nonlabens spongiae]|uniref:DUF2520 domain-containing protein n=1 Tax=Nonlabens spongiae TaxID=331648 RepID=A0A1W6MGN7_9FLAO|nr:DUF2520 domain-containing protein [Nonlabens spongiae]ARN76774.1 hypothetical protein BST97_01465 [Nonlabens spongiae]